MPEVDRLGRIEESLNRIHQSMGRMESSLDTHIRDEGGRLTRVGMKIDSLNKLHTRVALIEDQSQRQSWWNRTFIVSIIGLIASWIAEIWRK